MLLGGGGRSDKADRGRPGPRLLLRIAAKKSPLLPGRMDVQRRQECLDVVILDRPVQPCEAREERRRFCTFFAFRPNPEEARAVDDSEQ